VKGNKSGTTNSSGVDQRSASIMGGILSALALALLVGVNVGVGRGFI
jgi:hypothetical protein